MPPSVAARHLHSPANRLSVLDGLFDMLIGMPRPAHPRYFSILLTLVNALALTMLSQLLCLSYAKALKQEETAKRPPTNRPVRAGFRRSRRGACERIKRRGRKQEKSCSGRPGAARRTQGRKGAGGGIICRQAQGDRQKGGCEV